MQNEFNPSQEIKSFLLTYKDESYLKRPSIYYLENYADKLVLSHLSESNIRIEVI